MVRWQKTRSKFITHAFRLITLVKPVIVHILKVLSEDRKKL